MPQAPPWGGGGRRDAFLDRRPTDMSTSGACMRAIGEAQTAVLLPLKHSTAQGLCGQSRHLEPSLRFDCLAALR